ncbi:bifunctional solanapyrone synthase [Cladorrhinum sp. PSN332]|nr:bifunctional solanapyrone synthase [Cladorrhinum sp. PSN332]
MASTTRSQLVQHLIEAGLQGQILLPDNPKYDERNSSYWSRNTSSFQPLCIVQPASACDVSSAIKALVLADQKFAIRSGGCNFWPSNNIDKGVTIDLGLLNKVKYNPSNETVDLGPGARWGEVYSHLAQHSRAVAGGREAHVGVGGLVLGGGKTLFTGRHGFACDNVLAFEVVLASGEMVVAAAEAPHSELFSALKGGGNNFGVVTNLTMHALVCGRIWGGGTIMPSNVMPSAAEAFVEFTQQVKEGPDSSLILMGTHMNTNPGAVVVAALYANMAGVERPPIFDKWLAFPQVFKSYAMTTLPELLSTTQQQTGFYATDQIPSGDFTTQCTFQPLPRAFFRPGNVLGLYENQAADGILWSIHVMVRTEELKDWAEPRVAKVYRELKEFAEMLDGGKGGLLSWTHANYAHPSQGVLQSYGEKNAERMREVAARYDPGKVFQRLCAGGFKISQAEEQEIASGH